jgi:hypothetical protein
MTGMLVNIEFDRAVAQAVSRWLSTMVAMVPAQVKVRRNLWWTKRPWCKFSPSTLVSPAKPSTDWSTLIIINHPDLVQEFK